MKLHNSEWHFSNMAVLLHLLNQRIGKKLKTKGYIIISVDKGICLRKCLTQTYLLDLLLSNIFTTNINALGTFQNSFQYSKANLVS